MDSERIKLENYNGVLYFDACMEDEFSIVDLEAVREEIRENYSSCTNVICKESGCFSVAANVQRKLWEGIGEFINVVYVVDNQSKRKNAKYAAETYMRKYNTRVADSKEAAYAMLGEPPK